MKVCCMIVSWEMVDMFGHEGIRRVSIRDGAALVVTEHYERV